MPDTLNKQSLINLLIDSPLREPIKINLIDIINNTSEPDLPKVYSTITKELEIFQKATERRMKLAEETIAKLGGTVSATAPVAEPVATPAPAAMPPLDLPPLPASTSASLSGPTSTMPEAVAPATPAPLSVPPLDLPPMPTASNPVVAPAEPVAPPAAPVPVVEPVAPVMQPLGGPAPSTSSDEDALAEIQKELDSLKSATATEISSAAAPVAPTN
jgi:hypothetical protein